MKNKYYIFGLAILFVIVVMGFTHSNNSKFYYAYNEKVYLNELDNKLIVRYKQNKKSDKTKISLNLELTNKPIEWKDDSTCIITFEGDEIELFKPKILKQADVKTCNPVYAINTGLEMGVTDEFLVKFNENIPQTKIDELNKKFGIEVVKKTDIYHLLKVPNGLDALQIANLYQESGLTRFSYPNFYAKVELHQVIPNDTYFSNQFALHNTGQILTDGHSGTPGADIDALNAWTISAGSNNITIAVLDQGVTSNHPDLPYTRQVRLSGSNFADGDPNDPSPTGDNNHGNACAGTIGATQNNNQGITGIAPNCKIMPIRIFNSDGTSITSVRLVDAIDFARNNGADIISNSWGYNSDNPNFLPAVRDAIMVATTQGRNNLGCIVVFSAGNNPTNNGFVHFPSNVDIAGVLTVGASDRYDFKAYYSPVGDPLSPNNQFIDLVAPSHRAYSCQIPGETFEAWAIDIPGDDGYNSVKGTDCGNLPIIGSTLPTPGVMNYLDYTGRFGGTSYACPLVAGVAALILSINPNLTQQQVFDILTTTTDKVGGYTYTNGRSNELGFGRLNAYSAVIAAKNTTTYITGPKFICSSSIYSIYNLPLNASVSWSIPSNVGPVLQLSQNTPNTNQLTITNQHWYNISTTLTAMVTTGTNPPDSYTLPISNDNYVSGYYTQDACTCYNVYHPVQSGVASSNTATFVHMCCDVRVTLNLPANKTLTLTGSGVPSYWYYYDGILCFSLPYGSSGVPFTFSITPTTDDGECTSTLLFFAYSNNGNASYTYVVAPNPVYDMLNIIVNDNTTSSTAEINSTNTVKKDMNNLQFTAKIYDINYNKFIKSQNSKKGEKFLNIDVSSLKAGYYVVIIDDGSLTQTIQFYKSW